MRQGKIALVTGGSGDIGSEIGCALGAAGFHVILTFADMPEIAGETVSRIMDSGGGAEAIFLDQRSPECIGACAAHVERQHGRLDVLVNNGAWNIDIPFGDLEALTIEIWDRVLETNLRGPFLLTRSLATLLKASGSGHVVNISSIGGIAPTGSSLAYSVAKAGINHLTRGLALALAPDVAVNCIAPGLVENTRMANRVSPERREIGRRQAVLGRVGEKADIAAQVMTFVNSISMTGQLVAIDGGVPGAMR